MAFFKRTFQTVKEAVGTSKKTDDTNVNALRLEITNLLKKLRKVNQSYVKLPDTIRSSTVSHMQAMKDMTDVLGEGSCSSTCYSVFEEIDMKGHQYGLKIKDEVLTPLSRLIDMCIVLDKRFKVLTERRLDMDAAHDKFESIAKRPPNKQSGLVEVEQSYNDFKDFYEYLRDEILDDGAKFVEEVKKQLPQICANCMRSYTDYINDTNEIWAKVPNLISAIAVVDLHTELPVTPNEQSCVILENVRSKRGSDVSNGTIKQNTDYFPTTQQPAASIPQQQGFDQPQQSVPLPPQDKPTPVSSVVTALYDYTAAEEGELTFKEGDVIEVLERDGDWWKGKTKSGVTGIFPSNYVQ
ncbi:signal transducing adapter molecule, putative [Entamoeba invadens IP1]|uniref:Signal transducing adapter molecule, putative n=1 Tax=Entamoeba invadens IP1 TaxID=370355 RepID=A0A0A1UEV5_ENTIV|nr:signal transducing adapter molecule, putative [Entamoeba invadens IP1]ELP91351.1 signal transducing adapter molecule, putative [Entamoeba invadens IP1]|eukprot:XP_004258122.1 signal transducing adapter molecule, putative [Entamoeba invadens IP1]